jgi:predicted RNA methylase
MIKSHADREAEKKLRQYRTTRFIFWAILSIVNSFIGLFVHSVGGSGFGCGTLAFVCAGLAWHYYDNQFDERGTK